MNDVSQTKDTRVLGYKPLISPQILEMDIPITRNSVLTVEEARQSCASILNRENSAGYDDRLIVIVGPCSIHEPVSAVTYAKKLLELRQKYKDQLLIIMRTYFEKPRTTVGWKGLINDPNLDNSYKINKGLSISRKLLRDLTELGMPVASELLDTISPQYLGDFLCWGAIGARTTESQLHRELASGVSFPVGFKNGTDGNANIAIDAMKASSNPHHFMGITQQGLASIIVTNGNPDTHIILRGGSKGPNYDADSVKKIKEALIKASLIPNIMIDFSHGNSMKQHKNQIKVCDVVSDQIANGDNDIIGVMIESHLKEGRQDIPKAGPESLIFGMSITDACVSFQDTVPMLEKLSQAVIKRRELRNQKND